MNKNSYLLYKKQDNAAFDIKSNSQAKKTHELRHMIKLTRNCHGVRSVNVTSDNRYLIITHESSNLGIRVVDLEKLEFLPHKYNGHTDSVRVTSITSDNKAFYTASWDGSSRRFEIESGLCTQILSGFGRSPSCFLDQEGKFLFTASYDSDVNLESNNTGRCWDIVSGRTICLYKHTNSRICPESIDIAYNEGRVYTGSDDGNAYQWDIKEEKPLMKYFSIKDTVRKIAVSANYIAAACTDGHIRVHYKLTGHYYRYLILDEKDIREVRISKDETRLWSATDKGSVSCFNLITGDLIYHRKLHSSWIWSICLMNDEKILVTGSGDGSIVFLSADSGQILAQLMNLPCDNDILITCPPDKTFPAGFFYTTNANLIQVIIGDKEKTIQEILNLEDPRREAYLAKLNLKNLVITRLKNIKHYVLLTEQYLKNQNILNEVSVHKSPQLLML